MNVLVSNKYQYARYLQTCIREASTALLSKFVKGFTNVINTLFGFTINTIYIIYIGNIILVCPWIALSGFQVLIGTHKHLWVGVWVNVRLNYMIIYNFAFVAINFAIITCKFMRYSFTVPHICIYVASSHINRNFRRNHKAFSYEISSFYSKIVLLLLPFSKSTTENFLWCLKSPVVSVGRASSFRRYLKNVWGKFQSFMPSFNHCFCFQV